MPITWYMYCIMNQVESKYYVTSDLNKLRFLQNVCKKIGVEQCHICLFWSGCLVKYMQKQNSLSCNMKPNPPNPCWFCHFSQRHVSFEECVFNKPYTSKPTVAFVGYASQKIEIEQDTKRCFQRNLVAYDHLTFQLFDWNFEVPLKWDFQIHLHL